MIALVTLHSISSQNVFAKEMDPRVKPAGEGKTCCDRGRRLIIGVYDASLCAAASAAMRRSSKRCSLPVCVRGDWGTYAMVRGCLGGGMEAGTGSCRVWGATASPL